MAIAAKYATVAGDRVHPNALMRTITNSQIGGISNAEAGETAASNDRESVGDATAVDGDNNSPSLANNGEERTLLT